MYFPLLRKLDFPIIKHPGGVSDALRQHRETVAHLLGPDGMISSLPSANQSPELALFQGTTADRLAETEPANWYAGTSLDLPPSPGLASLFDFPDPVLPPAPATALELREAEGDDAGELGNEPSVDPDDAPEIAQAAPVMSAAVQNGTDAATLELVRATALGLRRSARQPPPPPRREETPEPSPSRSPSPPPTTQRKRTRCAEDDDDDAVPSPPPAPKKRKTAAAPGPLNTISVPPAATAPPSPLPPPPPPPPPRPATPRGDLVGTALPAAVQAEVDFIAAMPRQANGFPSRNKLRKAAETAAEISRKSGYLMTLRRGGSLRRWFGDEAVFEAAMWKWLVGEHGE